MEFKGAQIEKEVKISWFEDMIAYLSDPKNSTREPLMVINNFGTLPGYKINLNKSVSSLHSKDKQARN